MNSAENLALVEGSKPEDHSQEAEKQINLLNDPAFLDCAVMRTSIWAARVFAEQGNLIKAYTLIAGWQKSILKDIKSIELPHQSVLSERAQDAISSVRGLTEGLRIKYQERQPINHSDLITLTDQLGGKLDDIENMVPVDQLLGWLTPRIEVDRQWIELNGGHSSPVVLEMQNHLHCLEAAKQRSETRFFAEQI